MYLLTGPETGPIPGLLRVGRQQLAEALDWSPIDDFDDAFAEIEAQGMARADWAARLVWLPKALRAATRRTTRTCSCAGRSTSSPLPECALRFLALEALHAHAALRSPHFLDAFDKAFGAAMRRGIEDEKEGRNRSGNGIGNGSPNGIGNGIGNGSQGGSRVRARGGQEQEQDQKQKKDQDPTAAARPSRARTIARAGAGAQAHPRGGFDPLALPLPNCVSAEQWGRWVEHRRRIKKPLTEEGARLSLRKLVEFHAGGVDPERAIEESIANDWQGLFEPDAPRRTNGARAPPTQDDLLERNLAVAKQWATDKRARGETEDEEA